MTTSVTTTSVTNIVTATFTADISPTSISVPGLMVGDLILGGRLGVNPVTADMGGSQIYFERMITVNDEIQQLDPFAQNTNLSGIEYTIYLLRASLS